MLRFCGFDLELAVDSVLQRRSDEPAVYSATDPGGQHWLIVETDRHDGETQAWLCAPASPLVVDLVRSGRATPSDAVLHSLTGWVEVVAVVDGHSVPDRRVACSDLPATGLLATV